MTAQNIMNPKQRVAVHAANLVEADMIVGLGTGSTANLFIEALAKRNRNEHLKVTTVSSSAISAVKAKEAGLPVVSIDSLDYLDMYVDGADEVTPDLTLLKGRGQDLVREKLLASAADQFYVLVDESKLVEHIGQNFPVPVEVLPEAWKLVLAQLKQHGGVGELRMNAAGDNVAFTAHGSLVLDMSFEHIDSLELTMLLDTIAGVVEHGIFSDLASAVFIGGEQEVEEHWR
ncbi:Ribose 5-phosphate isomerase A [Methylophaga thiooxydans]|uniref:Ribose-5-phosphate isomerase A n=2 Tax=Methylophaga thiooxydans TaxID=392484 RepID=C0N7E9_9GAMM|nr:ribose-5-phosphate isomerase RpiA [Methylophaga thiooxydans]EEF79585.1 ribose 5-phosphate isomerase A [Methylophaga thiooxydans DMS010]KGM07513.1 Ribose 5-phosphate isomerase A [Methylophaga thiooxydans]